MCTARFSQHPLTDRNDQTAFFRKGDELQRSELAQRGMPPSDQRLIAVGCARCERDDRLVVQHELIAVDRVTELRNAPEPNESGLVERRVEERETEPRMGLRPVHGRVGFLQEHLRVVSERDPDAGVDLDLAPFDLERLGQRRVQTLGDARCFRGVMDALQDHPELVAAKAGSRIAGPDHGLELLRERLQRQIARVVTEPVVDALEVVQVDEQESGLAAGPLAGRDRVVEPLGEMDAVRETGQRVVERLPAQLLLSLSLGRNVEQVALQVQRLAFLVDDDHSLVSNPDPTTVVGAEAVLDAQRLMRPVRLRVRGEDPIAVFGMKELDEEQLVGMPVRDRVAEHVLDLAAREDVRADRVERVGIDHQRKLLHECAIAAVDLAALCGLTARRGNRSFALQNDAGDPGRDVDQLQVSCGRTARSAVIERERPDHLVRPVDDRRRPARSESMLLGEVAERLPEWIE